MPNPLKLSLIFAFGKFQKQQSVEHLSLKNIHMVSTNIFLKSKLSSVHRLLWCGPDGTVWIDLTDIKLCHLRYCDLVMMT